MNSARGGAARIIRRCALCRQADGPVKLGRSALGPEPQVADHRTTKKVRAMAAQLVEARRERQRWQ